MKILDLSAGKRNIWFNRLCPDTVFVDIRPEVHPTVIADSKNLPFPSGIFDLVVFDPPHMVHGASSIMGQYYGVFTGNEIKHILFKTSLEAYRVSTPSALLAFKWNDHDVRLDHTIAVMNTWEPLFGHDFKRSRSRSKTYWMLLRKRTSTYDNPESVMELFDHVETGYLQGTPENVDGDRGSGGSRAGDLDAHDLGRVLEFGCRRL